MSHTNSRSADLQRLCNVLQCVAVCCSLLQCVAVCGSVFDLQRLIEIKRELQTRPVKRTIQIKRVNIHT